MANTLVNLVEALDKYDKSADQEFIRQAELQRQEILQRFPLADWPRMSLERFALGQEASEETFCRWLEFRSRNLGSLRGGSSRKLIIYKHKDKPGWYFPPTYKNEQDAWSAVRAGFVQAFESSKAAAWSAIDDTEALRPGPALKLKTLHVYFPADILSVYSKAHIQHFLRLLGRSEGDERTDDVVRLNRVLLSSLRELPTLSGWTTVELMRALYRVADPREQHRIVKIAPGENARFWQECLAGNADADQYVDWFRPFAKLFRHVLKENGSLVIDIGGAWQPGLPVRSLYHFKLLIMLCDEFGFHLAQDFYWWNPSKLPTPAEWVTVRRIRVKDAINCVWWLSPSPWPRASNRRVLQPYSASMQYLLRFGYRAKRRPSGHDISKKFATDNGAAIPPNLIALPNTESNSHYLRYCAENNLKAHPARYPSGIPEYFIRMLTDPGDSVCDPFAGSCVTGEVAEKLRRRWICIDLVEDYLRGAIGRFKQPKVKQRRGKRVDTPQIFDENRDFYRLPRPGLLWNHASHDHLDERGGEHRLPIKK